MIFVKYFEKFSEKVWRKINFSEMISLRRESHKLTDREKKYLIDRSKGLITNDQLEKPDINFEVKSTSDGYYLLSFKVYIYDQPYYIDFLIDGIDNLSKYGNFGNYLNKTLVVNKSRLDLNYARENFDVDEDFIKLFLQ